MKETILLTGASSGIGYEMAKLLAERKFDLILVSRDASKLNILAEELRSAHQVTVHVFAKDLSTPNAPLDLYNEIRSQGLEVTMLVNNAGVGTYGDFAHSDLDETIRMINLNITSLVVLTRMYLDDMLKRKRGRIMNVASLLSFLPFPYYSVYSSTKAFVLAFSETLAAELEGTGVVVTALCPGPVDTAFNTTAMLKTKAYKTNKPISPVQVAKEGVELLVHGRGKKIVGFNNWFISNLPRITPDKIMMKIKKNLASPAR